MKEVSISIGRRTRNLSEDRKWQDDVQSVFARLDENQRRWVAALFSKSIGHGGLQFASHVTGLDLKTVRSGQVEIDSQFADCPEDRIRREGAGRPPAENMTRGSRTT